VSETPQRETYPLVSHDDTLVMVFRDHITAAAQPQLYLRALTDSVIRVDAGHTLDLRPGLRVVNYTNGAGDTLTITVNGTPTVRTEGVDFGAVTSNEITALNIKNAINAAYTSGDVVAEVVGADIYLNTDHTVDTLTIATSDATAWNSDEFMEWGPLQTFSSQESDKIALPPFTFDPLNKVCVLNVMRGKVSADLRSLVPVRTYFQMPTSLRATTGHPGGWPTSP
jgi:hypothetical protein